MWQVAQYRGGGVSTLWVAGYLVVMAEDAGVAGGAVHLPEPVGQEVVAIQLGVVQDLCMILFCYFIGHLEEIPTLTELAKIVANYISNKFSIKEVSFLTRIKVFNNNF